MPRTQAFAHLISDTTHTTLYESLASVEQDEACLSLEAYPQGLYSDGFASCFAIIFKNINDQKKIALAHVSSIVESDIDFFDAMLQSVSITEGDVTIELARSMQGYTNEYKMGLREHNDGTMVHCDADAIDAATFFAEADKTFQLFFETHFGMTPPIREMQAGMIVINCHGTVDYLEPHLDGEITLNEWEVPKNKRPRTVTSTSNGHSFFDTSSSSDSDDGNDSDENMSPKRQKNGGMR